MFDFVIDATSGPSRIGTLTLPHGTVETPVFMPVGTQGTVRALSPNDVRGAGATLVLANAYHLHVRPGEQVVEKLGALHRFMGGIVRSSPIPAAFSCSRLRDRAAWTRTVWSFRVTWTAATVLSR